MCKRWKALSKEYWRSVKVLDLSYPKWGSLSGRNGKKISKYIIRDVLLRCGSYLRKINLSLVPYNVPQNIVNVIGKYGPNLRVIDITGVTVSTFDINSLINNCRHITKFSVGPTVRAYQYICDKDLQKLFKRNPNLRYFKAFKTSMSGKCLLHLPLETIEIDLECCTRLQQNSLAQVKLSVYFNCLQKNLILTSN